MEPYPTKTIFIRYIRLYSETKLTTVQITLWDTTGKVVRACDITCKITKLLRSLDIL
jgi:hypothetical protein